MWSAYNSRTMSVIKTEYFDSTFDPEKSSIDSVKQLLLEGELLMAEQMARHLIRFDSDNAQVLELLGLCMLQQGNASSATPFLEEALELQPSNPDLAYNLAGAYYSIQEWEKACASYRYVIKFLPNSGDALKGLGASLYRMGRLVEAEEVYWKALSIDPKQIFIYLELADLHDELGHPTRSIEILQKGLRYAPADQDLHRALGDRFVKKGDGRNAGTAFYNLGVCLHRQKLLSQAVVEFKKSLELNPGHAKARYSLAMLTGENLSSPPPEYVVDLFNEYAGRFDKHLDQLYYKVPHNLFDLIMRLNSKHPHFKRVLDLGCGTGKCGVLFKDFSASMTGVDIAPRMLELARLKNVYDDLVEADGTAFLVESKQRYDLVIAADVFIYVGRLDELFQALGQRMAQDGLLAFSTESWDDAGFRLRSTGRYAHSDCYIDDLAKSCGFVRKSHRKTTIRMQSREPIPGSLFVYSFVGKPH
jgi:predicted TPR repeat methyltransferase